MAVAVRLVPSPMAEEVRQGLLGRPRTLPSKYFYDDAGSRLYEAITALPEYYQSRTEEALLRRAADDVVARTGATELVELGAGAGRKIRTVIEAARQAGQPVRVLLLDIHAPSVSESARRLMASYPGLLARGLSGDFTGDLKVLGPGGNRLVILFGGTIGNFHPRDVPGFVRNVGVQLAPGDHFLVGIQLVTDVARLEAAYNDAQGITGAFNLNILVHVNRELGADFDVTKFAHRAFWDPVSSWIEMRLVATEPSRVRVEEARLDLRFQRGDEIRTEISCKYTRAGFEPLLAGTGFGLERWYEDGEHLFALALLRRRS